MKTKAIIKVCCLAVAWLAWGMATTAWSQDVDVRLSARQAYVEQPIVLQIVINNAKSFEQPTIPEIDGCDVEMRGTPSVSTQTMIINGRRSDRRSVVIQYLITPRRAGEFEIPTFAFEVDGRTVRSEPIQFSATTSETGDLLFVEIEGGKDQVYVGQPLDLTLKIWIKPFVDDELDIRLSEGNMWSLIAKQTSWGNFRERLRELADNNQRPGGIEVLRDNGHGKQQAYYLYEVAATVYPKRPGKIDADDVQIIVDYPTALGKSRDPFGGMFDDDIFGGGLLESPFRNRLTITDSRPIVADAAVDSTEVLEVPSQGRPADYRGAVGSYQITTVATPTRVTAGDPITLQIGIVGTGPMELVQAPPLAELPILTSDFKVEDQSLGGFVEGNTKLFTTTIRPRREGLTSIPAIPFSYFDPETQSYHTVSSEPISISVDKAETLSLDAIAGKEPAEQAAKSRSAANSIANAAATSAEPSFVNSDSVDILQSETAPQEADGWLVLVIVPPFVWLSALLMRHGGAVLAAVAAMAGGLRSAESRCLAAVQRARDREQLVAALMRYVNWKAKRHIRWNTPADNATSQLETLGALRLCGLYGEAAELDAFFAEGDKSRRSEDRAEHEARAGEREWLASQRERASQLVWRLKAAFDGVHKLPPRKRGRSRAAGRMIDPTTTALLLGLSLAMAAPEPAWGWDATAESDAGRLELTRPQQVQVLAEASAMYAEADAADGTDQAGAKELFTQAAAKYQQLVDSGIRNSRLYVNLGNAYLRSNQLGRAMAAYEHGRQLDPRNRQFPAKLELAQALVKGEDANTVADNPISADWSVGLRRGNAWFTQGLEQGAIGWTLGIASLLFWGMLTIGVFYSRFPYKRLALLPLVVMLVAATSVGLSATDRTSGRDGIVVVNHLVLRAGDGQHFAEVAELATSDGHRVHVLAERGGWLQVRTQRAETGWVPRAAVIECSGSLRLSNSAVFFSGS